MRSADRPTVKVLCAGTIVRDGPRVLDACSTVTLVESGTSRVVVDTGSPMRLDRLTSAFAASGVRIDSIEAVVNTHMHMDHCGGNDLFEHSTRYAHRLEEPPVGTVLVEDGAAVVAGVTVMETPGHTAGSISVLVDAERRYALCGDAIPTQSNYETMAPPAIHIDRRLAVESMNRILAWADIVVPGHGSPFVVRGKK